MKVIDIALKDLSQSFRSYFALAFMFGIPILVTGLFYFMFGGLREDESFSLSRTKVHIANLDQGSPVFTLGMAQMPEEVAQAGVDMGSVTSMGELLVQILQSEDLAELMEITLASDADSARAAVDNQDAGVAVIIPENFTAALVETEGQAVIELYQDPTLTLGPDIVRAIMGRFVETFAGAKIGLGVTLDQLNEAGVSVDGTISQKIAMRFLSASTGGPQSGQPAQRLAITPPSSADQASENQFLQIISLVMGGMMVFYAFFTGAATAQSILTEEENGTLSRLFTTPTSHSVILSGKFLAVFVTVLIQMVALLVFADRVFGIRWGDPVVVALVTLVTVVTTATFGLFLVSFLKDRRQAGIVFGGVLTMTGMPAMVGVFVQDTSNALGINKVAMLFPQGWAVRGLRLAMDGADVGSILLIIAGMLVMSGIFFAIGYMRLKKRFA